MGWIFLLALLLLGACVLWLRHLRRDREMQHELIRRMQGSRMYQGLHDMLMKVPREYLEHITIRPEEVCAETLDGKRYRYVFEQHDMDPIRPEALLTLAQAVAFDVPEVQDSTFFAFRRDDTRTPAGDVIPSYSYLLRPRRKNYLIRAMKAARHA